MMPLPAVPSSLINPAEALFDNVTTCAAEPAERSALMPSDTAVAESIHNTAWVFDGTSSGKIDD